MKPCKQVYNPQSDLTFETLKTMKGFENITEAEAPREIEIIKRLAKILFLLMQEQTKETTNNNSENYENNNG